MITVNPFDNFYRFTLSRLENDAVIRYNLNDYTEIKMTIKGPKKDLNFNVFRESNENDFENGVLVFRISESMNAELGRLAKKNFNLFYINGIDVFGNRQIIYSGFYKMWDSKLISKATIIKFMGAVNCMSLFFSKICAAKAMKCKFRNRK